MNVASRLALNMAAWAVSIPILNLGFTALERHRILPLSGYLAAAVAIVLLAWAALIYWRGVPSTPSIGRRVAYLAAFVAAMIVLGIAGIWAAFWVIALTYGL